MLYDPKKQEPEVVQMCTYFYGKIRSLRCVGKWVIISNGRSDYFVSSPSDKGLAHLSVGKRRLVIIKGGKIAAIYIRRRPQLMNLINRLANGDNPDESTLTSYKPIYPEGMSKLKKKGNG